MNMDLVGSLCHKDFSNITYPKSLGVPTRDKEAFLKHYATVATYGVSRAAQYSNILHPAYIPLQLTFHSVVEAPGKLLTHVRFTTLLD